VVVHPLVEIERIDTGPVDLNGYDWLVLTSATAAHELKPRARGRPRRVAAIGRATAAAWGAADLVPRVSTQEGLLAELPQPAGRVLFAGAEGARPLLVEQLGAEAVVLYRARAVRPSASLEGDVVVLASPSAARSLAAVTLGLPVVTIGPETTAAAAEAGLQVLAEARTADLSGLVSAVRSAG
jgi:uroporphyrinogen-III synthase